jgi:hypothetical protein
MRVNGGTEIREVKVARVMLDRIRMTVQLRYSYYDLHDMALEQIELRATREMAYMLTAFFAGKEEVVTKKTKVPASWWDAVKERFIPWAGVKYREIPTVTNITRICPHLPTGHYGEDKDYTKHIEFIIQRGLFND